MKNVNPVGFFDISVSDLDRAKKFYEEVFNIKFTDLPSEWGKQSLFPSDLNGQNISGSLVEKKDRDINGNNTMIYFSTEDCTSEENRVEKAGGKIISKKISIGGFGFISIIIDTEWNNIGLHSKK